MEDTIPVIHSPLFRVFLKEYKRHLQKSGKAYATPPVLKGFCSMIYIHKDEPFRKKFESKYIEGLLEYLNSEILEHTSGMFQLDKETEQALRRANFKRVLLAFFHLKGFWSAEKGLKRSFLNGDGTITQNVEFIRFRNIRVVVEDGTMEIHVPCKRSQDDQGVGGIVCFTMPADEKDGIFEHSMVEIPEVCLKDRQVMDDDENGITIIHFQYKQSEKGINAKQKSSMPYIREADKKFVFDKPFRVSVRYMSAEVLRVEVDNVREVFDPIASLPWYS